MKIDCRSCEMYRSSHCDDCLVSVLLHPPGAPVEMDAQLSASLDNLTDAGLIPVLKFRPRAAGPPGDDVAEAG